MIIKISTKSKTMLHYVKDTVHSTNEHDRTITLLPSGKVFHIRRTVRAQVINDRGTTLSVLNRKQP